MATLTGSLYQDVLKTTDAVALLFGTNGTDGPLQDYVVNNFLGTNAAVTTVAGNGQTLLGDASAPHLVALGHNDLLIATTGNEIIEGGAGNDKLVGGWGDNILSGGAGNDTILAGRGQDIMVGGSGHDTFVFGGHGGNDIIVDFKPGEDIIQVPYHVNGSNIANAADVAFRTYNDGYGNTVVDLGNHETVTLLGVAASVVQHNPSAYFQVTSTPGAHPPSAPAHSGNGSANGSPQAGTTHGADSPAGPSNAGGLPVGAGHADAAAGPTPVIFAGGGGNHLALDLSNGEHIVQIARHINDLNIRSVQDLAAHVSDAHGNAVVDLGHGDTVTLLNVSAETVKGHLDQFFTVK